MKILLTGGTGGLGLELARAAQQARHVVRVASRRPRPTGIPDGREWATADVESGNGLSAALAGVDAVIHAASDPRRHAAVDVGGTRRLVEAAQAAGITHLVYISIVGIDEIPLAYYRSKLAAERIIQDSGVPHSILRATQFHTFVATMLEGFARVPLVMPLPGSFRFQPVATEEVAHVLVRAVEEGPRGRLRDFGGPEVRTLRELAEAWQAARGIRKPIINLPIPGRLASAFRQGKNTVRDGERGMVTWQTWRQSQPASSARS